MNLLPKDLLTSFEQYDAMQEAHLKSLETEGHPDLNKYNFERSRAFEDLKNQLSLVLKRIQKEEGDALQIALACQGRLASIIERDDLLARRIGKYRDNLGQILKQLDLGKKALQGYGRPGSNHSPRFVNKPG